MPRAKKITAEELVRLSPSAKGVWRTTKKGTKIWIYEKGHKFPRGHGSRLLIKRNARLSSQAASVKAAQERAERQAGIKKGTGLFDDPFSPNPRVTGVTRIVRKAQIKALVRKYQAGKIKKLPKRAQKISKGGSSTGTVKTSPGILF